MSFKIDQSDNFGVGFNLGVVIENHSGFPLFLPKSSNLNLIHIFLVTRF